MGEAKEKQIRTVQTTNGKEAPQTKKIGRVPKTFLAGVQSAVHKPQQFEEDHLGLHLSHSEILPAYRDTPRDILQHEAPLQLTSGDRLPVYVPAGHRHSAQLYDGLLRKRAFGNSILQNRRKLSDVQLYLRLCLHPFSDNRNLRGTR